METHRHDEDNFTPVERAALTASPFAALYPPRERIPALVVDNFPALGRLTALRFLEWARAHPEGVVSLPTGKTPEHFIHWVTRLRDTWREPETRALLEAHGIAAAAPPAMNGLHFVQIDEFYPIDSAQANSFFHYVNHYYIDGFGLAREKALLIDPPRIGLEAGQTLAEVWPQMRVDLSLRHRAPRSALEATQQTVLARIDQWCQEYEERIRDLGGIGFFLGGIGPDGHIGFNVRGSDHYSTTRLTPTNYPTQAAAATDLGGIEIARSRHVVTIGLGTIAHNPDCVALIIAAGEAKAPIVADAIEHPPDVLYPATALQALPRARFYLTRGAARRLQAREQAVLIRKDRLRDEAAVRILVDLALKRNRRLLDLTAEDFAQDPAGALLLQKRVEGREALVSLAWNTLVARVEAGADARGRTRFLHTEPHHDDVMLGYLPAIVRHIRDASNSHFFATLTSGFTSVTNRYMQGRLEHLLPFLDAFAGLWAEGYFAPANLHGRNRDVWQYLDGVAARNEAMRDEGAARRLLRDLCELYDAADIAAVGEHLRELTDYFATAYPGKKDPPPIQRLKGMCREWEVECLWGYLGWNCSHIRHLRLGFYTGDIFTEEPTAGRDVPPILALLREVEPQVLTVAFDPEASGPDTHYKVMQAINEAVKQYLADGRREAPTIWGYRNVWYRFHPAEANIYVPVSLNMLAIMRDSFLNTFLSQREASFPSHEHDGPFCELAQRIQVEQYQAVKTCLGREWFHEHPRPLIRATRGLVFLKEMALEEFQHASRELKRAAENA